VKTWHVHTKHCTGNRLKTQASESPDSTAFTGRGGEGLVVQKPPGLQTHAGELLLCGQTQIVEGGACLTRAVTQVLVQPQACVTTAHTYIHSFIHIHTHIHTCHSLSTAEVQSFRTAFQDVAVLAGPLIHSNVLLTWFFLGLGRKAEEERLASAHKLFT